MRTQLFSWTAVLLCLFGGAAIAADGERPKDWPTDWPLHSHCLAFSSDGKRIAYGGREGIALVDLAAGKAVAWITSKQPIASLAFSPDGSLLAAGAMENDDGEKVIDGSIMILDPQRLEMKATARVERERLFRVAFTRDSKHLIAGGLQIGSYSYSQGALKRDAEVSKAAAFFGLTQADAPIIAAAFDKSLTILPAKPEQTEIKFAAKVDDTWLAPSRVAMTNAGDEIAWSEGGGVTFADAKSAKKKYDCQPLDGGICSIAYSHDGKFLAVCGYSQKVVLWDVKERRAAKSFDTGCKITTCVAFSPDGKQLAAISIDPTSANGFLSFPRLWSVP